MHYFDDQAALDSSLAKWTERLRLRDWRIRAVLVHEREVDAHGDIRVIIEGKRAFIRIANSRTDEAWGIEPRDHEHTLVHELLHIFYEPIWPKEEGLAQSMAEQGLNEIAFALITAWRPLELMQTYIPSFSTLAENKHLTPEAKEFIQKMEAVADQIARVPPTQ